MLFAGFLPRFAERFTDRFADRLLPLRFAIVTLVENVVGIRQENAMNQNEQQALMLREARRE